MKQQIKLIDSLLPQTQCGECGFNGCMPYAEALVNELTTIDKCPPGGIKTLNRLAQALNIDVNPYLERVKQNTRPPAIAVIREDECIGCTKCIQACPVDAIIGSAKQMHSIITTECTGCGLCVEPCPVDCIEMMPISDSYYSTTQARGRYQNKLVRQLREQHEQQQAYRNKTQLTQKNSSSAEVKARQQYILDALTRVNAKKNE